MALVLACIWPLAQAQAQGIAVIRDAEIEDMIRDFARPIWEVAGLNPDHVAVHIVQDKSLNAFVAGGQRIFVNTGLLTEVDDPNQLIGVLAHETGHITGGHLARTHEAMADASTIAILSMLAGLATVAAGAGDAGAAMVLSSSEFAGRNFLAYSRTQESAADQAGMGFLEATEQSGRGLIEFLERLGDQEALLTANQDPYIRSHPLTRDRVARLRSNAEASEYWDKPDTPKSIERLGRAQAKILGYLEPKRALVKYKKSDSSLEARYGRAFALYRESLNDEALTLVNGLIEDHPQDPYFHELKGQILFEAGELEKAGPPLEAAIDLMPREPLFRNLYAQVLISEGSKASAEEAITHLKAATLEDKEDASAWHMMAQAYHMTGNEPMADLATAEKYLLTGQSQQAVFLAGRALKGLERDTPSWWRAQDIVYIAESNGVSINRR